MLKKGTYHVIFAVTIIVVIGKILGFLREIIIADVFGAAVIVDSFLMAESASVVFLGWLSSFATIFVPVYQEIVNQDGPDKGNTYTLKLLIFVGIISITCIIIVSFLCSPIIKLSAPGYNYIQRELTERLFIIVVWSQLFSNLAAILTAYLNCKNYKIVASASLIIIGISQLGGVFVAWKSGNELYLAFTSVLASILQLIYVFIISKRAGFNSHLLKYDGQIKKSIRLVIPIFITSMITEINTYFDKLFASYLPEGTVSILHFSSRIRILFSYVFSTVLQTVLYPELSEKASRSKEEFVSYVRGSSLYVLFLFVPLSSFCLIYSKEIITLIYGGGAFDYSMIEKTGSTFFFYSISLTPLAIRDLLIRALYSMQKTKQSMYIGILTVLANIVLNRLLIDKMQHNGLALATSLSSFLAVLFYYIALYRLLDRSFFDKEFFKELLKIISGTCVMCALLILVKNKFISPTENLRINSLLLLLSSAIVGTAVYVVVSVVQKAKPISSFTLLKKRK